MKKIVITVPIVKEREYSRPQKQHKDLKKEESRSKCRGKYLRTP